MYATIVDVCRIGRKCCSLFRQVMKAPFAMLWVGWLHFLPRAPVAVSHFNPSVRVSS